MKTLAEIILAEIEARGISQAEISRQAGLGLGTINEILANPGRSPRVATVIKIATALGRSPSAVLAEIGGNGAEAALPRHCDAAAIEADPAAMARAQALSLAAGLPGARAWRALRPLAAFGIDAGDILFSVDAPARDGEIVIVERHRDGADAAEYLLRRLFEPRLIPAGPIGGATIAHAAGVEIRGVIAGIWRPRGA